MNATNPRAPDDNPVVDQVPPTDHRVNTTVLYDTMPPQEAKNHAAAIRRLPAQAPGDVFPSDSLVRKWTQAFRHHTILRRLQLNGCAYTNC